MGVDRQDGAAPDLTYEQRLEYLVRTAALILAKANSFAPATVATARLIAEKRHSPLEDASFDFENFRSAVIENAAVIGNAAVDVGHGATAALSSLKWVLPVGLLIVAGVVIVAVSKRAQRQIS